MSRHPEAKWAQRLDKIYLTVLLPDAKNPKVNLEPDGVFMFSATAGTENHVYELKLYLHDKVRVQESKINIGLRNIVCILEKAEKKWWKKLLHGDEKAPHYVKVDWDKWVDEDDDTGAGPSDFDLGGMDFSKFAGMGDNDMGDEDSDDAEEDTKEPVEKADRKAGEEAKLVEGEASEGKVEAVASS